MSIDQITDHEGEGLDRLAEQFRGKANITGLLTPFLSQIQELEDTLFALIEGRSVFDSTGSNLDEVGAIVGQARSTTGPDATDDEKYRALIFGRILINTSHGEPEKVLQLMRLLGADDVLLVEYGLASIGVQYLGELITDDADTISLLEQATGPIEIQVSEYTTSPTPFGFAGTPGALGFGEGALARAVIG